MKIGFIGLGIMGKPMAINLIKAGFKLYVNDVNPNAMSELEALGAIPASKDEIAAQCAVALTILPNGDIVKDVLISSSGLLSKMKPGSLVIDMSSITPIEARECGSAFQKKGIDYLDAPVSGGEPKAIDGTLAFMVGGTQNAFERAKPLFKAMGTSAVLVGDTGAGCITKLSNQIIVNLTIAAVSEALTFAAKAGVDPGKVYQAIRGGLAGSTVLDAKAPMMLRRNYVPGGKISINKKDINNVMKTAADIDMPVFLTSTLQDIMTVLKNTGHFEDDHGGIIQFYEYAAQTLVSSEIELKQ